MDAGIFADMDVEREDDATGNAGLSEDMETEKAATGEEDTGVSADMGDDALLADMAVDTMDEAEIGNAMQNTHLVDKQSQLLFVLDDDHSSPENIHEVTSLSPSSNSVLDTPVGYKLPARKNRGKPPARYSPSTEGKQSQYPFSNHVTTQRLTKPLRDFTDKLRVGFKGLSKELEIEPDLVSYNTVLKAFCEMGSLDSAVTLLDEMEKKGLESDLITFNTLLNGFYAKGRFVDGERIWEQMKEKNVEPDVRSYNAKLLGLALERRMEDAVKVVEEMKSGGIQLDTFSYSALIRGFVNDGDLKKAKHWYHEIGRSGCKLDRLTLEGLIPFALQKGDFMFAYGICKYVLCSKLSVQNVLIQSVVDALAKKSKIEAARELVKLGDAHHAYSLEINWQQLLDEMEKKGLGSDLITFNTLLHGFYVKGRFVDGERIWTQMKDEQDVQSYSPSEG
ncbi:hypothetical protein DKX38_016932 [Salix brachista]|uniref:Pentacotripeptide-repeat region of PRORP domain-containing protein n=1 Tax=Salix brachista TaxID=2182728 RepID=A0A5N5KV25_9ROSI|nr:hypothetical protein DKX38_016932 [Salix brachista]